MSNRNERHTVLVKENENCPWFETKDKVKILVLPWVSISEDLDNSSHIDGNDDTHTFAVFNPSEPQTPILSWFLFPAHGVAIQISGVMMVSWEGNILEQCTCLVIKGVLCECLKNEKRSTRHVAFETAYNKPRHNNILFKGMTVMVRQKLEELNDLGAWL